MSIGSFGPRDACVAFKIAMEGVLRVLEKRSVELNDVDDMILNSFARILEEYRYDTLLYHNREDNYQDGTLERVYQAMVDTHKIFEPALDREQYVLGIRNQLKRFLTAKEDPIPVYDLSEEEKVKLKSIIRSMIVLMNNARV